MSQEILRMQHVGQLKQIRQRLDAVQAAVRGAEMNDSSEQAGIVSFIGDIWCRVDDLIVEVAGKEEAKGHVE